MSNIEKTKVQRSRWSKYN